MMQKLLLALVILLGLNTNSVMAVCGDFHFQKAMKQGNERTEAVFDLVSRLESTSKIGECHISTYQTEVCFGEDIYERVSISILREAQTYTAEVDILNGKVLKTSGEFDLDSFSDTQTILKQDSDVEEYSSTDREVQRLEVDFDEELKLKSLRFKVQNYRGLIYRPLEDETTINCQN